jgi:cell division protein ZapA
LAKTGDGIRVEIYDQQYTIRGDLDPEYIQRLASYLDGKMRTIAERTRTVDSLRVAVLAALNVADEYHRLQAQQEATTKKVEEIVGECNKTLDRAISEAS